MTNEARKLASGAVIRPHVMVTCSTHVSTHLQRITCVLPHTDGDATVKMLEEDRYERDMHI